MTTKTIAAKGGWELKRISNDRNGSFVCFHVTDGKTIKVFKDRVLPQLSGVRMRLVIALVLFGGVFVVPLPLLAMVFRAVTRPHLGNRRHH